VNHEPLCLQYHDKLLWYSANQLTASERSEIEAHLATCASCRAEVRIWHALAARRQQTTQTVLSKTGDTTFPSIIDRLYSSVSERKESKSIDNTQLTYDFIPDIDDDIPPHKVHLQHQFRWRILIASTLVVVLLASVFLLAYRNIYEKARQPLPANIGGLSKVVMVSATEGWAIDRNKVPGDCTTTPTPGTAILHYQHGYWSEVHTPYSNKGCSSLDDIVMVSANEGWAMGTIVNTGTATWERTFVMHYIHGAWQDTNVDYLVDGGGKFLVFNSKDIWLIGGVSPLHGEAYNDAYNGDMLVLHYNGSTWTRIADPKLEHVFATTTWGSSSNDFNVAGFNGNPCGIESSANDTCPSKDVLLHYDGHTWIDLQGPDMSISSVSFSSSTEGWATGCRGQGPPKTCTYIAHFHNGKWDAPMQVTDKQYYGISSILMLSPTEGWAVGRQILHYSNGVWTTVWTASMPAWIPTPEATSVDPTEEAQNKSLRYMFAPFLSSISMISPTEGWAVGTSYSTSGDHVLHLPLLMHCSNGVWSVYTQ
jgi:Putative zinc-finger